jgi:hypothetical protein
MRLAKRAVELLACGLLVVSLSGSDCLGIGEVTETLDETTTKTVGVLQDGIDKITTNLSSWQTVLQDMQRQLTADAQSSIRNEITNLLQGSIAVANSSVQCTVDFVGKRAVQTLQRLLAKLKGQPPPDVLVPTSCSAVPAGIEYTAWQNNRVPKVDIFGYDFDASDLTLALVSGTTRSDITPRLQKISNYQFSVPLGGSPPLLNGTQQSITLVWKGNVDRPVSQVPVLLPVTPVCQARSRTVPQITPISFNPPKAGRGDREFAGNGPDIWTSVTLRIVGTTLQAVLYMRARETGSDWTECAGTLTRQVYQADPGWRIDRILTPSVATDYYRDDTRTLDKRHPGGPVSRLEIVGDTGGSDVGETGMTAYFSTVRVWEVQTNNCVSPAGVREMIRTGRLSGELQDRFRLLLDRLPMEAFPPTR